jgi:hypothetical protein
MLLGKRIGVVGSRIFGNYQQLATTLTNMVNDGDSLVSGGAIGADSMAQRYAKDAGMEITIFYPNYVRLGKGATFARNKAIVEHSDVVVAFYAKGKFQIGGTSNTIYWCKQLGVPYYEYEEELIYGELLESG